MSPLFAFLSHILVIGSLILSAFPAPAATMPDLQVNVLSRITRDQVLMLEGWESTNPRDYDPATVASSSGTINLIFSGLVSFNPGLELTPELAESWDISENGTVYTFKLRPYAHFQDGSPVTAQDFIYSWERAADPAIDSGTVLTYLGDIVGVREKRAGKADSISGLKALDEHTLQVTIDAPKPYFLLKLTYPTAYVVNQKNIESGSEWYRNPVGTGPYRLREWKSFEYTLLERNDQYYLQQPSIPYIYIQQSTGGLLSYENGNTDIKGVSLASIARVLDPKDSLNAELRSGVSLCTDYLVFDVNQPPFDDVKVRQAFSMAFDRQKYIDVVLRGAALPAKGLYPPALPGYNPNLKGLPYDVEGARKLLAESKYGGPDKLPAITFSQSGTGYYVNLDTAALVQMWQDALGVKINIESLDSNKYYDEIGKGYHGQIFSGGWCADYPDPENFADVLFHSGAESNHGNYSNPELDAILEQARVEQDVDKRIALYQQAEEIIVNDAPVLFTSHGLSYVVVKPYIKGYVLTPMNIPIERYLSIDPSLVPEQ
ncbi:MAG: peptide ABC transporter substrate-binding protein [Anaerolineae bacterium]|nr:peptide ABC transporter substrate-binding protein [Anaerolineae bacterium]